MKRLYRFIVSVSFIAAVTSSLALEAQHESRDLSGTVADRHHEPLRGAVVQAHNLNTKTVRSFITGRNGQYSFKRLDGNCDYKISATWRDQRSALEEPEPLLTTVEQR